MDSESPKTNRNPMITGIIAIAVLVLVVGAVALLGNKDKSNDDSTPTSSQKETTSTDTTESDPADPGEEATAAYKDGTYTASGTYTSPGGTEDVEVTVTLDGNTIKNVDVQTDPASPTSEQYQGEFKSGYKNLVVGKDIDDVKLSKVSGSSLTSQGFNAAIEKIKQQAQSAS